MFQLVRQVASRAPVLLLEAATDANGPATAQPEWLVNGPCDPHASPPQVAPLYGRVNRGCPT